eukprot:8480-Heterococcus_DN1.PRE.1
MVINHQYAAERSNLAQLLVCANSRDPVDHLHTARRVCSPAHWPYGVAHVTGAGVGPAVVGALVGLLVVGTGFSFSSTEASSNEWAQRRQMRETATATTCICQQPVLTMVELSPGAGGAVGGVGPAAARVAVARKHSSVFVIYPLNLTGSLGMLPCGELAFAGVGGAAVQV